MVHVSSRMHVVFVEEAVPMQTMMEYAMTLTLALERLTLVVCVMVLGPFTTAVVLTFPKVTAIVMAISLMPSEFVGVGVRQI